MVFAADDLALIAQTNESPYEMERWACICELANLRHLANKMYQGLVQADAVETYFPRRCRHCKKFGAECLFQRVAGPDVRVVTCREYEYESKEEKT